MQIYLIFVVKLASFDIKLNVYIFVESKLNLKDKKGKSVNGLFVWKIKSV